MGNKMSKKSRLELATQIQSRYLKANNGVKGKILDEFVESTGYHRKTAIRLLHSDLRPKTFKKRPGRKKKYPREIIKKLERLYEISNYICGQRLQPYISELIDILERCNEMYFTSEEKRLLTEMSSATINRNLREYKKNHQGKGKTMTKPGGLLKKQIAIRTGMDWDDNRPGFLEIDLVAHCGQSAAGTFFYTLTATDVCTGWTDNFILRNKSKEAVVEVMTLLESLLPYPILGIDSDNGSEFINYLLFDYCNNRERKIIFTRSRPYRKNDQAHVEQKNWAVVRRLLGYNRFYTPDHFVLIQRIYQLNHVFNNFFQPVRKTIARPDKDAGVFSPKYESAKTPFRRILPSDVLSFPKKASLVNLYNASNPVKILAEINDLLRILAETSSYQTK